MAAEVTIGGSGQLFVGEDKTLVLELIDTAGLPVNMAGWALVFDVRKKDNSAAPAIFSKTPTITGVFNAARATNTQRATVSLSDDELNTITNITYRHSWKRIDAGIETVVAYGPMIVEKATAP